MEMVIECDIVCFSNIVPPFPDWSGCRGVPGDKAWFRGYPEQGDLSTRTDDHYKRYKSQGSAHQSYFSSSCIMIIIIISEVIQ